MKQSMEIILRKGGNTFFSGKRKVTDEVDLEWKYIIWQEQQKRQLRKKIIECATVMTEVGQLNEEKCEIFLKMHAKDRINENGRRSY